MTELNGLRIADRKHIGLAEMLKGGVIMDVTNAEQAKIAEDAGAASVMALERVPADIRKEGGVARMASVKKIKEIQRAVTIPVMAKCRIGHFVEAVRHMRAVVSGMRRLTTLGDEELMAEAKTLGAPYELLRWVAKNSRLPVPNFSAGGIATPADAALMMQLGAESVFVGSGVFKSQDPQKRAWAIVQATTHYKDPDVLARVSEELGEAMVGLETSKLAKEELLQTRGW
ncbi:MAG: pyridoxal 5'-phosphate synthase lyase subunit PdxS [Candidatus Rokuibacteriota bacterium]